MPDKSNITPSFGALIPDKPYDVPDLVPPSDVSAPLYPDAPSIEDKQRQSFEDFKRRGSSLVDPSAIVQPIRWDDASYKNLQETFDNPERGNLFQKLGFTPFRDNEDYFANSLSKWQKLGLAWDQMGALAKNTFAEQWETEAEFWGNLATGRVKKAFLPFGDEEELQDIYNKMKAATTKNYIPLTSEERMGEFGFGKFATSLGQFGFTLGTIGAYATQMGIEMAVAALTAPETGGASVVATGANLANKANRTLRLSTMFKNLSRFENSASTTNRIKQAYDYLSNTQNLKTGFGKFYTFTKEWNAAAGEAKFEAAFSYGDHINNEIEKARQEGRILSIEEKDLLAKDAKEIAMKNGVTNTGLLFMMNRMNMNNLFRGPLSTQKRYLTELASNLDDDLVEVAGKMTSRFEVPLFSKAGMKQLGTKALTWTTNSAWEGVQEVAQGASSNFWENFYENKYNRDKYSTAYLLGKTISDKLDSKETFEEFISGFIIGVPGTMVNSTLGAVTGLANREQRAQYKQAVSDYAKKINDFENDPFRVFDPRVANMNTQKSISKQMDEAVRTNNIYAYKNLVKEQMRDMVMLGIRTGKLDYMIGNIKDQLANISDEEFQKQFGMVSDATNRKKAQDYVSLLESEANSILVEYDKAKQQFANPYSNTKGLAKGSEEEKLHKIKYQAWEDAVQDLVFEKSNYMDTLKRMKSILGDSSEYIGEALYNPYYTMSSAKNVDKELLMLRSEIQSDKAIENPDQSIKDRIAKKSKQYEALLKWKKSYTALTSPREGEQVEELFLSSEDARKAFTDVLNAYQTEENLTALTPENVSKAYQGLLDFFKLQTDNETAVRNLSFLASPEGFEQNFNKRAIDAELFYNYIIDYRRKKVEDREEMLQALEADEEFANKYEVVELRRQLNDAMINNEYDTVEVIMDVLEEIYRTGKVAPAEVKAEDNSSADKPEVGVTEEGDYLIAFEGVNYQVFKEEPDLFYVEMPDGTIDGIENANVPPAVKEALAQFIKDQEAPITVSVSELPVTPQELLSKIATADRNTLTAISKDLLENFGKEPYSKFSETDMNLIFKALETRDDELSAQQRKTVSTVGTRGENDADFIREYNEGLAKVRQIVNAPDVTVKEVKAAFGSMMPVLNTLADKAIRNKYTANLLNEQNAIIARIEKINNSKDVNLIKANIQKTFDESPSIYKAIDDIVLLIENSTDPSIKEEVIEFFDKAFKKKIDEHIASLKKLAGEGISSETLKKFTVETTAFREKVIAGLQELVKVSAEIAEESEVQDYSLAVDVDDNFTNPTHRWIMENIGGNVKSTVAQRIALQNLLNAGVITQEEINAVDDDILLEASELINRGVARIFTIGINKELHRYFTLKKTDRRVDLEKLVAAYVESRDEVDEDIAKDIAKQLIDNAEKADQTIEQVLYALEIPGTSIISDEHRDLLERQRRALNDILRSNSTLDVITTLDETQKSLTENPNTEVKPESFITDDYVKKVSKITKKDVDRNELKADMIKLAEEVIAETDSKEAIKKINAVVKKYSAGSATAISNLKNVFISTISYIADTKSALENFEVNTAPLNADEMEGVLAGNQVPLTLSQINQVEDFALNVILEEAKKRFSVLSGYTDTIDFNPEMLAENEGPVRARFSVLRLKDATDMRTAQDLAAMLKVDGNTINAHDALRMIVESDYATSSEKIVATRLLSVISNTERININNTMIDLGDYDPQTGEISINLEAVGYKEGVPTYPVETLILHELLHRVIEEEAANPKSEFYRQMRSVIEAVKGVEGSKTFYAFQANLTEDEQVREFVIEALTNPAFQHHLAKIPYGKSQKTVWQKFIEVLAKMLEVVGLNIDQTALSETLNVVDDLLVYVGAEEMVDRIRKANKEELSTLKDEVQLDTTLTSNTKEAMLSMINQKLQGYKSAEAYAKAKGMKSFKASDGKTYYYGLVDGVFQVMYKTRSGYKVSRKDTARIDIIKQFLKDKKIKQLIPQDKVEEMRSLAGDPNVVGTYASGQMIKDGITIGEERFPNAMNTKLILKFSNVGDYIKFRREYWAAKRNGSLKSGAFNALKSTYGTTAVQDYAELANQFSRTEIDKLVRSGFVAIGGKGDTLSELTYDTPLTDDELFDMYKFVLEGGKMDVSEYDDIANYINSTLKKTFGIPVSVELQKAIENQLFVEAPADVDTTIPTEGREVVVSTSLDKGGVEDPNAYAVSTDIEMTNTAVETNPLRSFSPDGFTDVKTGDFNENSNYQLYYHKVRAIINALSVKNSEDLKGLMVTLDKDNELLRWDGSAQSTGWQDAPKGVIGYLSDKYGNPHVFNKKGEIVGTLDRTNLADQKTLNDGENQIVYFTIFANPSTFAAKQALNAHPEEFRMLMDMRQSVMSGTPMISAVTRVSQGQFNKKVLNNPTNKNRQDTRNADFRDQLLQPNVTFSFSKTAGTLLATITAPNGAKNTFGLFAPNMRYVNVTVGNTQYTITDYVIELMRLYNEIALRDAKEASAIQNNLAMFNYNMWLTGMDKNIQIPKNMRRIAIKEYIEKDGVKVPSLNYYNLFDIVNGEVVPNEKNIQIVRNYLNNQPMNVWSKWLTGAENFMFPVIDIAENGEKSISFIKKDYKDFLLRDVGMKSNVVEIPQEMYLKAYNSIIHFTEGNPLTLSSQIVTPTTNDIIENPNIIKTSVQNKGDDVKLDDEELKALKKGKRFKVPGYTEIFEKTCR